MQLRIKLIMITGILLLLINTLYPQSVTTDDEKYYFYHGYNYGSESLVHPLRLIINGGFGILQMGNRSNSIADIKFSKGMDNVWKNLTNPVDPIKDEGVYSFFQTQVIPLSFDEKEAYYWPNYTLHLVGGGMSYRMMEEWFRFHDIKYPKLNALLTISVYHLLNEVVENSNYSGYNTDVIADMYIFNPLGILLFSSDKVARFFSHTLNMNDWSYQPAYNPVTESIENHGQNFVMKYWLTKRKNIGLFYHFGTHGEVGLSFQRANGDCFSFGAGLVANELIDQSDRENLRQLTADLVLTAGIFYDRNNSLLASLFYSKKLDHKIRLNLYPGLIKIPKISPGFYAGLNQKNKLSIGLTLKFFPIGFSKNL